MKERRLKSRRLKLPSQPPSTRKPLANHETDSPRESTGTNGQSRRRVGTAPGGIEISPQAFMAPRIDSAGDGDHGLAALVWKHFETEIREALIEVQDLLDTVETDPGSGMAP